MQRLLIVLEAGSAYPSGYVRGLIYRPLFEQAGIKVRYVSRQCVVLARFLASPPSWIAPLMNRVVTALLYRLGAVYSYLKEPLIAWYAKRVDVVYMSKVTSFRLVKMIKSGTRCRLVLDFGDALWLPSARPKSFEETLRLADAVTTDNSATAKYVSSLNKNCVVIPDTPQLEAFDARRSSIPRNPKSLVIGWVGSPSTLYNLSVVWEALEKLFAKHPHLHLRLVGTGQETRFLPPFESVRFSCKPRYSQAEMIEEVLRMDIGLFPLQNVQASEVRGILKATVYMAGEVAVIASPVGQTPALIQDGVNGLLATTLLEWETKLDQLIRDEALRKRLAKAGLETVRREFSLNQAYDKLFNVLTKDS